MRAWRVGCDAVTHEAIKLATSLPQAYSACAWPWVEVMRVRRLGWSRYTLGIANLPAAMEGLRVVHVSDVHIDRRWMPAWTQLHKQLAEDPPDLIFVTGDWVEHKFDARPALPMVRRFVDGLRARIGVYGILGNHDTELLPVRIDLSPVRVLCNEIVTLTHGDATLQIVGVHGIHSADDASALREKLSASSGALRLMLAHYPSQIALGIDAGAAVVFAGHTHGGQVCLPGGVPMITHDGLPKRFSRGVHRFNNTYLAVSRGLGFSSYSIRAFCPAEVIEVVLKSEMTNDKMRMTNDEISMTNTK